MLSFRREKGVVGLDIGSYSIKALELKIRTKNGKEIYEVNKIGYELLPRDAIVEGTIIDSGAVMDTLSMIFDENKISNKNVIISISGNSVIIKKISLPPMNAEELEESIIWEAKHNIPIPYEETSIDYTILKSPHASEEKNFDILLVGAKKDKISNYTNVISQAQMKSEAIEVDVFALQNAVEINYPEIFREKKFALINLGAHLTNVIIIEDGIPQLYRDLSVGGSLFTENLSKSLNVDFDDAEKVLRAIPVQSVEEEHMEFALNMNVQNLLEEIEKTLSFYEAGEQDRKEIDLILLSGGLSKLKGLTGQFEKKFNIKTSIINPFRKIHFDRKKFDSIYIEDIAPHFGVVMGLATRQGER